MSQEVCEACNAFVAECYAPVGEASRALCWLCAHHVVGHDTDLKHAPYAECECDRTKIYPLHVLQRQSAAGLIRFKHGDGPPKPCRASLTGHFYNPKTGEIESTAITPVAENAARRKPS